MPAPEIETLEPRANPELIGHESAERQFLDAWSAGRMPHAWLIAGPSGVGKATLAYRVARFVLAGEGSGGGLFGGGPESLAIPADHPAFRKVAAGAHPDLRILERGLSSDGRRKQSDIPVESVREAGAFLSLTPGEGGWRVMVVDSADDLNKSGANALLKPLEEPKRNTLILLISHAPDRLLPTIRSRCRRLLLRPLAAELVASLLRKRRPDLAEPDALAVAHLAEGSAGRALALVEGEGLSLYKEMLGLIEALPRFDVPALHGFADKVGGDEERSRTVVALYLRWLARAAAGAGSAADADAVPGEAALGRRLIGLAGVERWLELWDRTVRVFDRVEAVNLDRKQAMLNGFLALERALRP